MKWPFIRRLNHDRTLAQRAIIIIILAQRLNSPYILARRLDYHHDPADVSLTFSELPVEEKSVNWFSGTAISLLLVVFVYLWRSVYFKMFMLASLDFEKELGNNCLEADFSFFQYVFFFLHVSSSFSLFIYYIFLLIY